MNEAGKLFPPDGIRSYTTVKTAIGLLRSTGLRVSELTSLKLDDARLNESFLFINGSKFKTVLCRPIPHRLPSSTGTSPLRANCWRFPAGAFLPAL